MLKISEFSGFASQLSVFRTNRFRFGNSSSHTICRTRKAKPVAATAYLVSFPRISARFCVFAQYKSRPCDIDKGFFQYLKFIF